MPGLIKKCFLSLITLITVIMLSSCGGGGGGGIDTSASDAEAVASDASSLVIVFNGTDTELSVTNNFTLPASGANGAAITWESDNPDVITINGIVIPAVGEDKTVTLTATIKKGNAEETKTFTLKVMGHYSISGTISGLNSDGLVLQLNEIIELPVANGSTSFSFGTYVSGGTNYRISVKKNPQGVRCVIGNSAGTVNSANITNVTASCGAAEYGTVFKQKDIIDGVRLSTVDFADIDGDKDQDMLVMGYTASNAIVSRLYINDGSGNFTKSEQSSDGTTPVFTGVFYGSSDFADIDKDGDPDLIITGTSNGSNSLALLYINNGSGIFTKSQQSSDGTSPVFTGVNKGSSNFADIDKDGDIDLLITGTANGPSARFYLNNGIGKFAYNAALDLLPVYGGYNSDPGNCSVIFADFDKDGDLDIILCGTRAGGYRTTYLYLNNGSGTFTKSQQSSDGTSPVFTGCFGSSDAADIDKDGDLDVIIAGNSDSGYSVELYINDGSANFTKSQQSSGGTSAVFTGLFVGFTRFADVDGDGDQDLLITGTTTQYSAGYQESMLYINNGSGIFTKDEQSSDGSTGSLTGLYYGSGEFADIDNDGDKDLVMAGYIESTTPGFKIYRNDGKGRFSGIKPVSNSSQSYADVDKDGDLDLLITGIDSSSVPTANLYLNDGKGNFYNNGAGLTGVNFGSSAFGDIDSDGDMDIVITGYKAASNFISCIYINDGSGKFTKSQQSSDGSSAVLTGVYYGSSIFGDVDNDGDPDLIISGKSSSGDITRLYINNGGSFSEASTLLTGVYYSSAMFGDFDKDNDLDLVYTGYSSPYYAGIYTNSKINTNNKCFGSDYLEAVTGTLSLAGAYNGSVNFADVNGDGWLDLFITGHTSGVNYSSRLYINNATQDLDPFTYSAQSIIGVWPGSSNFGDIDKDGDQDLIICGNTGSSLIVSLYTNDSSGNFTLQAVNGLTGVTSGASSLADFDGDGDLDLIVTGNTSTSSSVIPSVSVYYNVY